MWVICRLNEAPILGGQKSKANTSSLWGRRGRGYTVPLIVTTLGIGLKDDKGLVFPFLHSNTLLGYLLDCPWVTTWLDREMCLGLAFTLGFIFSELPEKPTNLPNLKSHGAKYIFHWYDYLAAIVVP